MWQEIRLSSLGVIEEAVLELDPGFTVITGETGAGKTMVVTALNLLRGVRSDSALVRHGSGSSRVEARVLVGPDVAATVEDAGGDTDTDEVAPEAFSVVIGRTVSREGRSRAYAGGASVPASLLSSLGERLVAVHGQSEQHRLTRGDAQRDALDAFAGEAVASVLATYAPGYTRLREVDRVLEELRTTARERARELDLLTHGLAEIAAVDPQPGEDAELLVEENRLSHAETIAESVHVARADLAGEATDTGPGHDAVAALARARQALEQVADHDPALVAVAARVAEAGYLVADVASDLASYAESVAVDPARLAVVADRRAAVAALLRKYGASVDDVLAWAASAAARHAELDHHDDRVAELERERAALGEDLLAGAAALTVARRRAAEELGRRVSSELTELAMPHATVVCEVRAPDHPEVADLGPTGQDEVELLLAANTGAPGLPLAKGASGGELSRVMLALEVVLADHTSVPTMVFDEVDAGIGGRAAVEVGRRLAMLATTTQVVAVTHLPQVAAFADRHYSVVKADDGRVTTSGITALDGAERVAELSRMLAGLDGSEAAEQHARELLALAAAPPTDHA